MKYRYFLIILFLSCASYPIVQEREDPIEVELERLDRIKEWIRKDCGNCHTSNLPTAQNAALLVFDLKYSDWMSRMTQKQLEYTFIKRLNFTIKKEDRYIITDALGSQLSRTKKRTPN
jgi:hypothetical protein